MRTELGPGVYLDTSGPQVGFSSIPCLSADVSRLAERERKSPSLRVGSSPSPSPSSSSTPTPTAASQSPHLDVLYYPLKYLRNEWQQSLLDLGLGKKRVRHYLSDEILCHGSPDAPVTSEFFRPLVFLEAYKHGCPPSSAGIYMSAKQVAWLQDELYATSAPGGKNDKIIFADLQPDADKAVKMRDFAASRKVSFKGDTARFRLRCGVTTGVKAAAAKAPSAPAVQPVQVSRPAEQQVQPGPARGPTSFASLTRAERTARTAAAREEALRAHIAIQKAALPAWRRLYRNLERLGGAALSCDVESWTEDADVLLELGLAWFTWTPTGDGETTERDGGSRHFIIEETVQYRNEEITATREDYTLGLSETLPQARVSAILRSTIAELSKQGPLILVFHDASAETRYFQKLDVDPTFYHTRVPPALADPVIERWPPLPSAFGADPQQAPIIISDTQDLFCGWSDPPIKQINLGKACGILGLHDIDPDKLHNAGNDAFATLRVWDLLIDMPEHQRQGDSAKIAEEPAHEGPEWLCAVGDLIQF